MWFTPMGLRTGEQLIQCIGSTLNLSSANNRARIALEHLRTLDAEHLLYHNPKPRSDSPRDLALTPLELIDKIAVLIPPPRVHRHRSRPH
jgi:hypothetical protein